MALTPLALIFADSSVNATSYATASFTAAANRLQFCFIEQERAGVTAWAGTPTVKWTTSGTFWTLVGSVCDFTTGTGTNRRRIALFVTTSASAVTDTLTISSSDSQALIGAGWGVGEWTDADLTGGAGAAIVQSPSNSGLLATSASVTLASPGSSDNRPMFVASHAINEVTAPRTDWTEPTGWDVGHNTPTTGWEGQWRTDAFETTGSATWATSSDWGAMAAEVKAAVEPYVNRSRLVSQAVQRSAVI